MQSEALDRAGEMFSPLTAAFRSAVTDAIEEVRSYRDAHSQPSGSPAARAAAELGVFAAGHIDEDRFAALFGGSEELDADTLRLLDRALAVLRELSSPGSSTFTVEVAPGGDVAAGVRQALAGVGRAFGAARVVELIRTGRLDDARAEDPAAPYPFWRWTAAERRIAPPLIVRCAGEDLDVAALAAFVDGTQKLILLVSGPAAAAPLARLITPGTFVMQAADVSELAALSAFSGPGIAALVPDGCALFTHDPSAPEPQRLAVRARPEGRPRALRRMSAFQQEEALALLDVLERGLVVQAAPAAVMPVSGTGTVGEQAPASSPARAVEPADTLAAWLLTQAGLGQVGGAAGR